MESSEKTDTPRRSMRLQRQRAVTPDLQILGPRELMKLNKSRSKIDFDQNSSSRNVPVEIKIIPPTPISAKKRRHTHTSVTSKKAKAEDIKENVINVDKKDENMENQKEHQDLVQVENKSVEIQIAETNIDEKDQKKSQDIVQAENKGVETQIAETKIDKKDQKESKDLVQAENKTVETQIADTKIDEKEVKVDVSQNQEQTVQSPTENEEFHSAVEDKSSDKTIEAPNMEQDEINNKHENEVKKQGDDAESAIKQEPEKMKLDLTPQLMDESIISVPESPSMISTAVIKDSTFSPEVDTSIKDTRPHIDNIMTPIIPRNITLRTSTPLSQRVLMRDTPKLSDPVISALKRVLSPKVGEIKKLSDESINETFSGQFKMGNPLEKSILKSSRRKRSLSVTDGESFMQKKVNFMSPEIMNIDMIDEKMLQSFKEERENSMLKQALASGGAVRRKRSMSESGTPFKAKIKVPNFKAIHEQQFRKMESIVDHAQRRAERAKRLATPSKMPLLPEIKETRSENGAASKIPTRKPLVKVSSSENILHGVKSRTIKRSNSAETHTKSSTSSKIPTIKETENKVGSGKKILPRILDTQTKAPTVSKFTASVKKPTISTTIQKAGSTSQSMRAKVEERRERNMSLYKGNAVKAGLDHRKKNENLIKGVRLNRRFELQMQNRRMKDGED